MYKDKDGKDIEPEWHMVDTTRCPDLKCNLCYGRLLYSKYYHPRKCDKCGKLWMEITKWVEVKELS
jgi:hypothetical protein